jgi:hypothetical protein
MVSDESDVQHNPMHMFDRALVLAAFSMRRLSEKRLITDALATRKIGVRSFPARRSSDFRKPFIGMSGGHAFTNYEFDEAGSEDLTVAQLANEIIHSLQIALVEDEPTIPTGILVASDWNQRNRLLHFKIEELLDIAQLVLDDQVIGSTDSWDWKTGKVTATRE